MAHMHSQWQGPPHVFTSSGTSSTTQQPSRAQAQQQHQPQPQRYQQQQQQQQQQNHLNFTVLVQNQSYCHQQQAQQGQYAQNGVYASSSSWLNNNRNNVNQYVSQRVPLPNQQLQFGASVNNQFGMKNGILSSQLANGNNANVVYPQLTQFGATNSSALPFAIVPSQAQRQTQQQTQVQTQAQIQAQIQYQQRMWQQQQQAQQLQQLQQQVKQQQQKVQQQVMPTRFTIAVPSRAHEQPRQHNQQARQNNVQFHIYPNAQQHSNQHSNQHSHQHSNQQNNENRNQERGCQEMVHSNVQLKQQQPMTETNDKYYANFFNDNNRNRYNNHNNNHNNNHYNRHNNGNNYNNYNNHNNRINHNSDNNNNNRNSRNYDRYGNHNGQKWDEFDREYRDGPGLNWGARKQNGHKNEAGQLNQRQRQRRRRAAAAASSSATTTARYVCHASVEEVDKWKSLTNEQCAQDHIYIGRLRITRANNSLAYVVVNGMDENVADFEILGLIDRNRAINNDIVAVSTYPIEEWTNDVYKQDSDKDRKNDSADSHLTQHDNNSSNSSNSSNRSMNNISNELDMKCLENEEDSKNEMNLNGSENGGDNGNEPVAAILKVFMKKENENNMPSHGNEQNNGLNKNNGSGKKKKRNLYDRVHSDSKTYYEFDRQGGQIANKFTFRDPRQLTSKRARGKVVAIMERDERSLSQTQRVLGCLEKCERDHELAFNFVPYIHWLPMVYPYRALDIICDLYKLIAIETKTMNGDSSIEKFCNLLELAQNAYVASNDDVLQKYMNEIGEFVLCVKYDVLNWNMNQLRPNIEIITVLGKRFDLAVETQICLTNRGIDFDQFSDDIENHAEKLIAERKEVGYCGDGTRKDCRYLDIMTIDPSDAMDYDDAISVTKLDCQTKSGNDIYRIGIHIADVTHFVKKGDIIDEEAQKRGITVYLAQNRAIRLLPDNLTQLCSIIPNEDRFAFSVFVNVDTKGNELTTEEMKEIYEVKSTSEHESELAFNMETPWFGKTIVHSKAKLDYESATKLIEWDNAKKLNVNVIDANCCIKGENNEKKVKLLEKLTNDLQLAWKIAKVMRDNRIEAGGIQFNAKKVHYHLEMDGSLRVVPEFHGISNNLIEELMLLANRCVARYLIEHTPSYTVMRKHQVPSMTSNKSRMLNDAAKTQRAKLLAKHKNLDLNIEGPKSVNKTLMALSEHFVLEMKEISTASLLRPLLFHLMDRAEYVVTKESNDELLKNVENEKYYHYGLRYDCYTHFTSPIRRYADIMVHRLLIDTLSHCKQQSKDGSTNDQEIEENEFKMMENLIDNCNDRTNMGSKAGGDSEEIVLGSFIRNVERLECDAYVVDICAHSFRILISGLALEMDVEIESIGQGGEIEAFQVCKSKDGELDCLNIKWNRGNSSDNNNNNNDGDAALEETYHYWSEMRVCLGCEDSNSMRKRVQNGGSSYTFKVTIVHPNARNEHFAGFPEKAAFVIKQRDQRIEVL